MRIHSRGLGIAVHAWVPGGTTVKCRVGTGRCLGGPPAPCAPAV
ncbi:hypothetical protein GLA29479_2216 [Lysobacter antibioticus]|uniref:Uncharacterized protein n=1 Tax=Lysobacter antibioticus TaxID=84531 RepID=A0A0S2FFU4_LYSAN|nr:hypothetical protein GLA29479_2216 [Lysobacter antibioticus]ALN82393.1 hypothetical protein LA76x_4282 [Lysobacter antibioticus]